jgi:hypothetical protein
VAKSTLRRSAGLAAHGLKETILELRRAATSSVERVGCVLQPTLKNVSPRARTAPVAAPISFPAPHSVDMRKYEHIGTSKHETSRC